MNRKPSGLILLFLIIFTFAFTLKSFSVSKPIRIGVVSMITPVDTVRYYQEIIDYISAKLGEPVEMVYRKTYDEMDRMLEKGHVVAAFVCSSPYVEDRKKFGAELLVAPQVNGHPFYNSYIIVHKESGIKNLNDLQGRTFAFTDPKSNSGRLYPVYRLAKMGIRPEDFFGKYIFSYSHNKSVELVAKKVVDGASVESLVYNYMKEKGSPYIQKTRIIEISPEFGIPPMITTPGVPTFMKEKIREVLVNMHNDPKGRNILADMLIDKFVEAPDSNYDSVKDMLSFVSRFNVQDKDDAQGKDTVYVGVIPRDNPRIAYEKYQPIVDYLSETTLYKYELVLKKTYDDTVNALGHGEIDIAFLGPLAYLHAHSEYGAVSILKSITDKGESSYRSVIITKGDPVNELSDLKGKNFAFASLKSTSGNLIPRYLLAEEGIHLRELKKYNNFHYHDSVVKWVLKGKYDAGAVRESVVEKYLPLGLKIIAKSGPIPTGPVVVGPKTPYTIVEIIKKALLDLNKTEDGKEVLMKVDPELRGGFSETSDSDYEHIRKMINDIPKTCGMGCHPKIKL
jgi:phosphonate transport system substrate-binding protein